jgi:hypothetical protein
MTRQKTNHTSTQETQSDENQAIRAWSRQSISPIDLETLSPQNRARLNTAVMTLVDYLISVSPRT